MIYIDGLPTELTNVYAIIRDQDNRVFNGTEFVSPYAVADLPSYAVYATEDPVGSGNYACEFPTDAPAGTYRWNIYISLDDNPTPGDGRVGFGSDYWNGSSFGQVAPVTIAPTGLDNVIVEPESGEQPAINARQALGLMFDSAPGGLISGVQSGEPILVKSPSGVLRMEVEADADGNRTKVTFHSMP